MTTSVNWFIESSEGNEYISYVTAFWRPSAGISKLEQIGRVEFFINELMLNSLMYRVLFELPGRRCHRQEMKRCFNEVAKTEARFSNNVDGIYVRMSQ